MPLKKCEVIVKTKINLNKTKYISIYINQDFYDDC